MPRQIDSAVFPHLDADLDRVRDVLGPVQLRGRPELAALTDDGADTYRRLVRPTLTLLSYYLLTDPEVPADDRVVRAAAAVELLHLGSLYHDDVVDHAYERRGRPSANAVWGSHMAVLGGDSVILTSVRMLAELGSREVLAGAIAGEQMCAGMVIEAADLYVASRDERSYFDAIDGKTAAVLSLACRVGAMQAGRSEDEEEALASFGRHFGLAYQLYDDILDLTSTSEEAGKPVNTDLPEGIYTLPVIRAVARDDDLARLLRRAMTREQAAHARELVIASGAVDEARAKADEFLDQAAGQLAALPVDTRTRHAMTAYAGSVLDRRTPGPAVPQQSTQTPQAHSDVLPPQVAESLRSWMVDTGFVASPGEADYHRWIGAIRIPRHWAPAISPAVEQTAYRMAVLLLAWDDLFEDPQLTDPAAITALKRGMVATLRQDPEKPWRPGAIPTAWASLWPRLREGRSTRWQEQFLDGLEDWCEACEREAHHRINGYIPPTADYLPLRMSTSGIDTALACMEVHQGRELPSQLRNHPVIRRLEELAFWVTFVENDLAGLDQDEADQVPYNLVRAVRHETGCTRGEAVEQVQRQVADQRAQLEALLRYVPALLRVLPGLSGKGKDYAEIYTNMTRVGLWARESDRYEQNSGPAVSAAPDLERLRREVYYYPAAEPAPAVP
ncbi:polyprenyl synthetase family protein [Streptomyces gardneri]|uniref:polyprenyl synthetase family protein n=1 Tax=Nocardia TaxID=1817 RepID=UPI001357D996|nr:MULTISPECIES: polyprenyl synthetase family protein [Nocardia]MBF6167681.1 polyprenyl synthetase family protein [Streptomyces gardneri]MBF6204400.1 polyprenyl synthetase family protein [Streptomyces gardneri]